MTMSLAIKPDEPKLEAIYSWLEAHKGSGVQLIGWEAGKRMALLAYGDGADDPFGWADWMTKIAEDPSTLLVAFDRLELVVDEAAGSVLNATFLGAFSIEPGETGQVGPNRS